MAPNLSRGLQRLERGGLRAAFITTTVVMLAGVVGFVVWASSPLGPEPAALDALVTDTTVTVSEVDGGWLFAPPGPTPPTGLVLYPGGRVDPRSYAPLARAIAAEGHVVALASMPLNLAVFAPGRASALIDAADGVKRWAVGGHSLGGAMAAAYAGSDDERVRGLVLLAAYPAESADLSEHDVAVLSVVGSADEVINRESLDDAVERLPADTQYLTLEGGDHAQFGDYGPQPGDGVATMSAQEQLRCTVEAIDALLASL